MGWPEIDTSMYIVLRQGGSDMCTVAIGDCRPIGRWRKISQGKPRDTCKLDCLFIPTQVPVLGANPSRYVVETVSRGDEETAYSHRKLPVGEEQAVTFPCW